MTIGLPNAEEVSRALSALLRREVEASPARSVAAKSLVVAGLYHDGTGKLLGAVAADLGFAAHAGACFSLIPADAAEDCVAAGALDEGMRENFAEVLNVASRLFTQSGGARVALKSSIFPPTTLPPEALPAADPKRGCAFEISIDGYGSGLVCLRLLA